MSVQQKQTSSQAGSHKLDRATIDQWPISNAGFNVRVINALGRAGLKTVGELRQEEAGHLLSLRSFGRRSLENVSWFFQCMDRLEQGALIADNMGEILKAFMNPQERKVIEVRYGLADPLYRPTMKLTTLEDIGAAMGGLTRERVRQIEADALTILRTQLCRTALTPFIERWAGEIEKSGGAIESVDLKSWATDPWLAPYQPWGVLMLLTELNDRIACRHGVYFADATVAQLDDLETKLLETLKAATKPEPEARLVKKVSRLTPGCNPEWIIAMMRAHPEISTTMKDEYFHTRTNAGFVIHNVLKASKEPLYFEEVTDRYNEVVAKSSKQSSRFILFVLGEMTTVERLGNGMYKPK
jgi:hypothetical protein